MAKRKKAGRPHRPRPAAWLGAFSPRDGPPALQQALALLPELGQGANLRLVMGRA